MAAQAAIHEWFPECGFASSVAKVQRPGESVMPYWQPKEPCVYILARQRDGVLYTGVTSSLYDRMRAHQAGTFRSFTHRYSVHLLVYYEMHLTMDAAIIRETRIKKWERAWKVNRIVEMNPEWLDLFELRRRLAQFHYFYDTEYGSASFIPAKAKQSYVLLVSTSGLLFRKIDKNQKIEKTEN